MDRGDAGLRGGAAATRFRLDAYWRAYLPCRTDVAVSHVTELAVLSLLRRPTTMLNLWQSAILLALESTLVVNLRMGVLAGGGSDAWAETHLMLTEKTGAALEALTGLMTGDTFIVVVERYRGHVASNALRLAS